MNTSHHSIWLNRFAVSTAVVTLLLIGLGGMVTSKGAGMAVPDWPTTYGQNMFLFPVGQWIGGILYEHSHRLLASLVGFLTLVMAAWIWGRGSKGGGKWIGLIWIFLGMGLIGVRTQGMFIALACVALLVLGYCAFRLWDAEDPLRWWAMLAYSLVLVQGVLGGLRVTQFMDELGIVHGTIGQLFFLLVCAIGLVTSRFWQRLGDVEFSSRVSGLKGLLLTLTIMVLLQLILAASMRHQHAGLAVPDFPLAYGKIWPPMDVEFVDTVNRSRIDPREFNPIAPNHILLHMCHRIMAVVLLIGIGYAAFQARARAGKGTLFARWGDIWFGLVCFQAILGAATVWSNKSAEITTLHVMTGAICLVLGGLLTILAFRVSRMAPCERCETVEANPGPDLLLAGPLGA